MTDKPPDPELVDWFTRVWSAIKRQVTEGSDFDSEVPGNAGGVYEVGGDDEVQRRIDALRCAINILQGEITNGYGARTHGPNSYAVQGLKKDKAELMGLLKEMETPISTEQRALVLWKRWFEFSGDPYERHDPWFRPCSFCGEEEPKHELDCVYVVAKELVEDE